MTREIIMGMRSAAACVVKQKFLLFEFPINTEWGLVIVDDDNNNSSNVLVVHGHASQYPTLKILIQYLRPNMCAALRFFFCWFGWCCAASCSPRDFMCVQTHLRSSCCSIYIHHPPEKAEKDVKIILHSPSLVYVCFRLEIPFLFLSLQLLTFIIHHTRGSSRPAPPPPSNQNRTI